MTRVLYVLLGLLIVISCKRNGKQSHAQNATHPTSPSTASHVDQPPPRLSVTYSYLVLNDSTRRALHKTFDSTELKTTLAINRVDEQYLYRVDTLVVPDTFVNDFLVYAPFPQRLPFVDSVKKLLLCSYPSEAVAAYENGTLVRWAPASLGKKSTPTPLGLFHTNWKAKQTVSTVNEAWILNWYFNLANFDGVSLHEYELPGYPASHSCVRLRAEDARWIYYWAEQWRLSANDSLLAHGTPVIVYGAYDFKARKPWRALPQNPHAMDESEASLRNAIEPHLSLILTRQAQLDSVKATQAVTLPLQARK